MKTLIFILILLAFLQTSIIPINLVLIVLVLRVYVTQEKQNLYLAFALGLLISFLTNTPLGFYSISFLVIIELVSLIRKTPFLGHLITVVPLTLTALILQSVLELIFLKQSLIIWLPIIGAVLALPTYFLIRFWEERFVAKNTQIKLKV